jgi:hypothetical protein
MKKIAICILGLLMFTSCGQQGKGVVKKNTVDNKPLDDTIPKVIIPEGTIQVGYKDADTTSKIHILQIADYNKQDIDPKVTRANWTGLFYNKSNNFYIKPASLKFIRRYSEMNEKEDATTGWHITCNVKDKNIILVNGANTLMNGPVKNVSLPAALSRAGQKLEFNYYGVTYTLYTTGHKKHGEIYNYKVYLFAKVKGHYFNQLLYSLEPNTVLNGGGDMSESVEIEFTGDMDGDKIPDFIIGSSGYSYGNTYLYLSKPAGDKAILKLVSSFSVSD